MDTRIVKIDSLEKGVSEIQEGALLLDEGGLVAFPTETVYGIGCRVESESINRLDEVKGRSAEKRYTLHIAGAEELAKYVPNAGFRGRKLISKVWPGPLTMVFELSESELARQREKLGAEVFDILYRDESIGVRCPDDPIAKMLLSEAKREIVAPSANLAGEKPAVMAHEVEAVFSGKIDMIIGRAGEKEGRRRGKTSSTVVKVAGGKVDILRVGAISEDLILDMSMVNILFVCTGNTCRSPMAEWFCRKYLSEKLGCDIDATERMGYKVGSAGVMGLGPTPASAEVVSIFADLGIDVSGHRSRQIGEDLLGESDFVFVMSERHREIVLDVCAEVGDRCMLLDGGGDVSDPIGQGRRIYDVCAAHIEKAVRKRMCEILR